MAGGVGAVAAWFTLLGCASPTVIAMRIDARVEEATADTGGDTGACDDMRCSGCNCNPPRMFDDHVELPNHEDVREGAKVVFAVDYSGDDGGAPLDASVTGVVLHAPVEVMAFGTSRTLYTVDADASLLPISQRLQSWPSPQISDDAQTLTFAYVNCGVAVREVHTLVSREPMKTTLYAPIACCGWAEAPPWLGGLAGLLILARRKRR